MEYIKVKLGNFITFLPVFTNKQLRPSNNVKTSKSKFVGFIKPNYK